MSFDRLLFYRKKYRTLNKMPKGTNQVPRFFVNPYVMPAGKDCIGPAPPLTNMHKLGAIPDYILKLKDKLGGGSK